MSTICIAGRVGKDPEIRETKAGPVLGFSVAESTYENGEKGTRWFDVSMFGKRGESLAKVIHKGDPVTVVGEFGMREHNGKTYCQVRADRIELQGGKREGSTSPTGEASRYGSSGQGFEDLPF